MLEVHPPLANGEDRPHPGAVWFDLINPTPEEIQEIEAFTGLDLPDRDEMAALEQSSRLSFSNGVLQLAAPVIADSETDHPSLSPVGLLLTPKIMVSVRFNQLKMFDAIAEACAPDSPDAPRTSTAMFVALMEAFVGRQADLLEDARKRLDQISHLVFHQPSANRIRAARSTLRMRDKLQFLGRMGERLSIVRESLLAVERMMLFGVEQARDWFGPELSHRLATARADIDALNLFEEHLLSKVQFLLDAVLGLISIEQNDIFKVLTIASTVGIFPTLVAGWYGMNFKNIPEFDWAYGYQFGIGMIVLSTILPLLWFKWRGWF